MQPMTAQEFKQIRETLGLTQEALGKLLGESANHVYMRESGRRTINVKTALAMRGLWLEAACNEADLSKPV